MPKRFTGTGMPGSRFMTTAAFLKNLSHKILISLGYHTDTGILLHRFASYPDGINVWQR